MDDELADAYWDTEKAITDAAKKGAEDREKITAEEANARIQLEEKALSSMTRSNENYFEYKKNSLDRELAQYTDLYGEQTWITEAFAQKYIDLELEKMRASNDFFAGVKAGLYDITKDMITWGDVGYETIKTFADAGSSAMSDSFFAIIKGDIDSLGDIWKSFVDTMLKKFTDMLADMIMQWAMSGIADFFGLSIGGKTGGLSLGGGGGDSAGNLAEGAGGVLDYLTGLFGSAPATATMGEVAAQAGLTQEGLNALLSGATSLSGAGVTATMTMGELAAQAGLTQAGLAEALGSATYSAAGGGATAGGTGVAGLSGASTLAAGAALTWAVGYGLSELFFDKEQKYPVAEQWLAGYDAGSQYAQGWEGMDQGYIDYSATGPFGIEYFMNRMRQSIKDDKAEQDMGGGWSIYDSPLGHDTGGPLLASEMYWPSGGGPSGEGLFLGKPGEGVVNDGAGMQTLAEINSGTFTDKIISAINSAGGGSDRPINLYQTIVIDGHEIVNVVAKYGPGDSGFRDAVGGIVN